jgi:hypothetical protein
MVANKEQRMWAKFLLVEKKWVSKFISAPNNIKRLELVYNVGGYDSTTKNMMNGLRAHWIKDTTIQKIYGKWLVTQLS